MNIRSSLEVVDERKCLTPTRIRVPYSPVPNLVAVPTTNPRLTRSLYIGRAHICDQSIAVFLNCRAAARYWVLASIIPDSERPEETTICYKITLIQLITNLNVILYLSTCHTICISVLILFMIMP